MWRLDVRKHLRAIGHTALCILDLATYLKPIAVQETLRVQAARVALHIWNAGCARPLISQQQQIVCQTAFAIASTNRANA